MKKIVISVALLLAGFSQHSFAQTSKDTEESSYEKRKLKLEEVNFISSYYHQDGNTSAVEGGRGSEALSDIGTSLDLRFTKYDWKNRQHTFNLDLNIDHYTSASSDRIDSPKGVTTITSASKSDTHFYPSLSWNINDSKTGITKGISLSYSTEYDYKSYGINLNFTKLSKDKNREFTVKGGAFFDT